MATLFYSSPRARFLDSNANPLSSGRVSFYFPGTTTLKEIYTDSSELTPAQNPQPLDAEGYVRDGGVWLGDGQYDVLLEASDGGGGYTTEWTIPNVEGNPQATQGNMGEVSFVETIADLQNIEVGTVGIVYVFGYYSANDGGQGWFRWDANSTDAADGGAVIAPLGNPASGRYYRQFSELGLTVAQWGVVNNAPGVVDNALAACLAYVQAAGRTHTEIRVSEGYYTLSGSFTFTGSNVKVVFEPGTQFTADSGSVTLTITCGDAEVMAQKALVDPSVELAWFPSSRRDAYVEWWGADGTMNIGDALSRINATNRVLFTGSYTMNNKTVPASYIVNRAHFARGAALSFNSAIAPIEFQNATFDKEVVACIRGDYYDTAFFNREAPVRIFENALTSSARYLNMLEAVTYQNTQRGRLLWDSSSDTTSISAQYGAVSHDIESRIVGTKLTIGPINPTYIGTVVNGPEHIIDAGSVNAPIMINSMGYLQWFGTSPIDTVAGCAANKTALSLAGSAIRLAMASGYNLKISGGDGIFYLKEEATLLTTTGVTYLQDMSFVISSDWLGGIDGTSALTLDCPSVALSNVNLFRGVDPTAGTNHITVTGNVTYWKDSALTLPIRIESVEGVKLQNVSIDRTTPLSAGELSLNIVDGVSNTISGIHITDCYFSSPINISASASAVADDVYIVGNTSDAGANWLSVVSASTGHTNCRVAENDVGAAYWVGTEKSIRFDDAFGTVTSNAAVQVELDLSNIIFKTKETPEAAELCADYGNPTGLASPALLTYAAMFEGCPTFTYLASATTPKLYMNLRYIGQSTIGSNSVVTAGQAHIKWNLRDRIQLHTFDNP